MSELLDRQLAFAAAVPRLIEQAHRLGFGVTLGEAYRSPEEAKRLARAGLGIIDSLHTRRLALDLNLFKAGVYLTGSESYRALGRYWLSLSPDHRWGGDFRRADGNHFSLAYGGRA